VVSPRTGPTPSPAPSGIASPRPSPSPSPSPTPKPPARGFLLYRRSDPGGAYAGPIRSEPFTTNAFEDKTVSLGQRWCYVVGTVVSTEPVAESARSNEACVSVRDIVAPAAPSGVAALGGPDGVEVSWSPSTETDLASYRIYREVAGGPRARVGEVAPPETSLRDATAAPATRYTYTVTAVDRAGNESPPSAPAPGGRP
jgi:fibronectin type 3 domain-containing protein